MLKLPSPAKINHFLHIIGRREDGYHLLQTLFQFLDYSDYFTFELRQDTSIVLDPPEIMGIPTEKNLIYRAASMLRETTSHSLHTQQGVTIHVHKQIPLGAGLGGGSSNAATTLVALNILWQLNWSKAQLKELGLFLGSDVPIFIEGHSAWGEGIGEILTPVTLHEPWVVVVLPPIHVSTPSMYAHRDLTRNTPTLIIESLKGDEIDLLLSQSKNDFESLVRLTYPEIDEAMTWLSRFGRAQLSGSGASIFACFASQEAAQGVLNQLPLCFKGFIAKTMNQSPLIQSVKNLV